MGVSGMDWKYRTARKSFKTTNSGLQALFARVAASVTGLQKFQTVRANVKSLASSLPLTKRRINNAMIRERESWAHAP